jgi:hypothetical protein
MMLMPELTVEASKIATRNGAFYAVSHVDRREGINANAPTGAGSAQVPWLNNNLPGIASISVDGSVITINGVHYDEIEWIADGIKIASGKSLDISDFHFEVNNYVRAHLKSNVGIAYTQPFGVEYTGEHIYEVANEAEFINAVQKVSAVGGEIVVKNDITLSQSINLNSGRDVVISSANQDITAAITLNNNTTLWVSGTSSLTLDGVTLNVTRDVATNPNNSAGSFGVRDNAVLNIINGSDVNFTTGGTYSGIWFVNNAVVNVDSSRVIGSARTMYGFTGTAPVAYVNNSEIRGNASASYSTE